MTRPSKIDEAKIKASKFTQEHYNHINACGFNPRICPMCKEIDIILMKQAEAHNDETTLTEEDKERIMRRIREKSANKHEPTADEITKRQDRAGIKRLRRGGGIK